MNNSIETINKRRSLFAKQMTGAKIDDNELLQLLSAADTAPTHKTTEPWRFIIFKGESLHRLIDFQKSHVQSKSAEPLSQPKLDSFEMAKTNTSHIIAIVCEISGQVPEVEEICATACAVENFWIALCNAGYGGYWSTGNGTFDTATHQYLQLKENQKVLGFFYCGVPAEAYVYPPGRRTEFERKVIWWE